MRIALGSLALVPLVAFLGCQTADTNTRPPKEPMAYRAPPDDPAYSKPIAYPAEVMEQDPLIKKAKAPAIPGMTQRPGQMSKGMTGPGGGF